MQGKKGLSFQNDETAITYCIMKLSEFMKEKLEGRGTQAKFSRIAGISSGTVSKWAQGEMDRAPNFENCLRIANYFRISPIQVFEMANRPDYGRLFQELFPDYRREEKQITASVCPDQDPNHERYANILESVLHSNDEKCIRAVTTMLEAIEEKTTPPRGQPAPVPAHPGSKAEASSAGGGLKPEHGPFKVTDPVRPGDRIRIYDDTKEEPPQEVPHKRKAK